MTSSSSNVKSPGRSHSPVSYISSSSEDDVVDNIARRSKIPPVDPQVLFELEEQAKITGKSLGRVMKYLNKELHAISKVTKDTVNLYDNSIEHIQKEVELNIQAMYGLIAKCEELDRNMKPVTEIANQVRSITEMLDLLEQLCK